MLKDALLLIPGANYAVIAFEFVRKFWKPLVLMAAIAVSYHEGVKHERKKGEAVQLRAQLAKVTFERDNLKSAAELANKQAADLQQKVSENEKQIAELREHPAAGDCALSNDAVKRLRAIGGHFKR